MNKKKNKITININGNKQITMELDKKDSFTKIRTSLLDSIAYPFIFVYIDEDDDEEKEFQEEELNKKLEDILDGRNFQIKKK